MRPAPTIRARLLIESRERSFPVKAAEQRVLDAAERLCYARGVQAVGIDMVATTRARSATAALMEGAGRDHSDEVDSWVQDRLQ